MISWNRQEVEMVIRRLKANRFPGIESISSEVINARESSVIMIYQLHKKIYDKRECPKDLARLIVLIHKKWWNGLQQLAENKSVEYSWKGLHWSVFDLSKNSGVADWRAPKVSGSRHRWVECVLRSQSGSSRRKNATFSAPHFQWDWATRTERFEGCFSNTLVSLLFTRLHINSV